MIEIKVKRLNENAVIPFKTHDSDFCFDVVATSKEEIAPNVYKYGTGLAFEIVAYNDHMTNVGITLRPRSSIWKTGLVLSNGVGTIDNDYRGEVSAVFYHVMTDMKPYEVGDRIGQIHFDTTKRVKFVEHEELSDTERGIGGYGSTGK